MRFVLDVFQVAVDRRAGRSAAQLAYDLMFSLFPLLIMLVGLMGQLSLDPSTIFSGLAPYIPEQSLEMLEEYTSYVLGNSSAGMFAAGLLVTITSGSAGFRALISISSEIYGRKSTQGIVRYVVSSVVFSVLLLLMMYASMMVVMAGGWFARGLRSLLRITRLPVLWPWVRMLLFFSLAWLFLLALYWVTAPRDTAVRVPVRRGALLTACLLAASSALFSFFIRLSSRYSLVYGSLASIIILLLWLYLCGNIVVIGNICNYVWWRYRQGLPAELLWGRNLDQ